MTVRALGVACNSKVSARWIRVLRTSADIDLVGAVPRILPAN